MGKKLFGFGKVAEPKEPQWLIQGFMRDDPTRGVALVVSAQTVYRACINAEAEVKSLIITYVRKQKPVKK